METPHRFRFAYSIFAVLLLTLRCWSAEPVISTFSLANMSSDKVLLIYKDFAKCELIESSEVKKHHGNISLQFTGSKSELQKQLEIALLEQAGIVLTRLDDKRVSVTFDASLPIKSVVLKNPTNAKVVH